MKTLLFVKKNEPVSDVLKRIHEHEIPPSEVVIAINPPDHETMVQIWLEAPSVSSLLMIEEYQTSPALKPGKMLNLFIERFARDMIDVDTQSRNRLLRAVRVIDNSGVACVDENCLREIGAFNEYYNELFWCYEDWLCKGLLLDLTFNSSNPFVPETEDKIALAVAKNQFCLQWTTPMSEDCHRSYVLDNYVWTDEKKITFNVLS